MIAGDSGFRRTLRSLDVAAITFSCVVGSGIFFASTQVAAILPAATAGLAVWVGCGLLCLAGTWLMSALVENHADAGGLYTVLRVQFGEGLAFLYGWTTAIIVTSAVTAALASALGTAIAAGQPQSSTASIIAVTAILAAASANAIPVSWSKYIPVAFTWVKIAALVLFAWTSAAYGVSLEPASDSAGRPGSLQAVAAAIVIATWTFDGWTYAAFCGSECRTPADVRRGWLMGAGLVLLAYAGVMIAVYSGRTRILLQTPAPWALSLAVLVGLAVAGSLHAVLLTGSRCLYAVARDGFLPRYLSHLSPGSAVPVPAVILQASLAVMFLYVGGFYELLGISVAANWVFYATAVAAAHSIRRRVLAGAFCAGAAVILLAVILTAPAHAAMSAVLVASGLPVYAFRRPGRLRRRAQSSRRFANPPV